MKIKVKVKPNSIKEKVVKRKEFLEVFVNLPAQEGKANERLIEVLADYLNLPPNRIFIDSGKKSREKTIEIF